MSEDSGKVISLSNNRPIKITIGILAFVIVFAFGAGGFRWKIQADINASKEITLKIVKDNYVTKSVNEVQMDFIKAALERIERKL